VVILGSASFVPFMQLSAADRRTIIEDLLDINIFSSMNGLVKEHVSSLKDSITKSKNSIELIEHKIELQKGNIEEHKKHNDAEIERKKEEIQKSESDIESLNKDIVLILKHVEVLQNKITDESAIQKKSAKLLALESKLESKLKKIDKEVIFYEQNDNCPTCKQHIDDTFRSGELDRNNQAKGEVRTGLEEIQKQFEETSKRIQEIDKIIKHVQSHNNEVIKHNSTISAVNKYIAKLNQEISLLSNRKDNLEEENQKLKDLKADLIMQQEALQERLIEKQYYDYASSLLKDGGIKTKIIKQYLPIMNKLINKYLTAMDFFVNFNIDENFEETIKSRHRDEFTYANFSEGEKMRIDLALLFTWRQIAKLKNSTNTNLLILDEVFDSSLDGVGTEEFLKLIHEMGADTNIFVISHKGDQLFDKFRSIIRFEKKNNFSRIVI
jgi:DNA repair exonuclease SbcCD ATPase subunit